MSYTLAAPLARDQILRFPSDVEGGTARLDTSSGKNQAEHIHETSSSSDTGTNQKAIFEHASITSTGPTVRSSFENTKQDDKERAVPQANNIVVDEQVRRKYAVRGPSPARTISSDASHYDSTIGYLEDHSGVESGQIDRYGFFPESGATTRRRPSNNSHEAARQEAKKKNRRSFINRESIKRASVNIGITAPTDYMEAPKIEDESSLVAKELERAEKWRTMAHRNDATSPFEFSISSKVVDRVYKGIPDCWRASAWQSFLIPPEKKHGARIRAKIKRRETEKDGLEDTEVRYKRQGLNPCEFDAQIDLDVPRTISGHVLFRRRYQGGQRLLFRVLHGIALEFPHVGYVQGMASVAATLLCYYTEDQAFAMLTHLWTSRSLARLYEPGFPHLLAAFRALERRMQKGRVGRHLLAIHVAPMNFATRWYLTLFHYSLPFRTQLRVWDLFMLYDSDREDKSRGIAKYRVLEATTLALIEGMEDALLGTDFETAMRILTAPVQVKDDDRLMKAIRKKMN